MKIGELEKAELEKIRSADPEKLLRPAAVLEAARDGASPLHAHFEWDDTAAAEKHRLAQARELVRVVVTFLPQVNRNVRAYVSLPSERGPSGGYRNTVEVLDDAAMRRELLAAARRELAAFSKKYAVLQEVSAVIAAAKPLIETAKKTA